ncbi:DNA gyrase inhibitor YacG [Pseudoprimorskyibacter insulae]|uniref:DNA gyrase inhibitor YacG n=1 Tax=Pseudoprimorskyibacter insulae TaxID=1695997 RepID=A0A2R8AQI2_9RHOB|nr:DNA gyrase inhibitor YacG [Pseudoprimorskyibacter insulae]SPF78230.1 DNA gyrase inhibitor YacG [Pseudoprimorskyibacter insulae]
MSCPICSGDTDPKFRPFCSKRCADVDLSKWLSGSYALPSEDEDEALEALEEMERLVDQDRPH